MQNPLKGHLLIIQTVVSTPAAFVLQLFHGHESKNIHAVIQCYDDDTPRCKIAAIKLFFIALTTDITTAINDHKNRTVFTLLRCPNIQKEAIFIICGVNTLHKLSMEVTLFLMALCVDVAALLNRCCAKIMCLIYTIPMRYFHRVFPASGRCIPDTQKAAHPTI